MKNWYCIVLGGPPKLEILENVPVPEELLVYLNAFPETPMPSAGTELLIAVKW